MPEGTDVPKFTSVEELRRFIALCETQIKTRKAEYGGDMARIKSDARAALAPVRARIAAAKRQVYGLTFKKDTTA